MVTATAVQIMEAETKAPTMVTATVMETVQATATKMEATATTMEAKATKMEATKAATVVATKGETEIKATTTTTEIPTETTTTATTATMVMVREILVEIMVREMLEPTMAAITAETEMAMIILETETETLMEGMETETETEDPITGTITDKVTTWEAVIVEAIVTATEESLLPEHQQLKHRQLEPLSPKPHENQRLACNTVLLMTVSKNNRVNTCR